MFLIPEGFYCNYGVGNEQNQQARQKAGCTHRLQVVFHAIEFSQHPEAVGTDPDRNGQVVNQSKALLTLKPGDENRNNDGRKNHQSSGRFPALCPAEIFNQPQKDMGIFQGMPLPGRGGTEFIFHSVSGKAAPAPIRNRLWCGWRGNWFFAAGTDPPVEFGCG